MNSTNKNHPFRKRWGQNFLTDTNLLDKIARTIHPTSSDRFLEIGPGEGALTERIFPFVDSMVVVEIDPLLVKELKNKPIFNGMGVIHGDPTTSNFMVSEKIYAIDFGLSTISDDSEDRASDLRVFLESIDSHHSEINGRDIFLNSYSKWGNSSSVLKSLDVLELRGRYNLMMG